MRAMIGARPIHLEVDGGVSPRRRRHRGAGADVLVAGSAAFRGRDYRATIDALRPAA